MLLYLSGIQQQICREIPHNEILFKGTFHTYMYIHSYHFVCNYCFMSLILLICIFIHSSVLRRSTHLIYQTYLASRSTLRCVTLPIILPRPLMPLGGALVEYSVPTPPGERGVRRAANRGASGAICPKPQLLRGPQAVSYLQL